MKQSKRAWLWRDQNADTKREVDHPQGVPWSESARTAIRVLMHKWRKSLASLERILLPTSNNTRHLLWLDKIGRTRNLENCLKINDPHVVAKREVVVDWRNGKRKYVHLSLHLGSQREPEFVQDVGI